MTKNFDEAAYLQRRAANEAKLTEAGVYGPQMEPVSYTHLRAHET